MFKPYHTDSQLIAKEIFMLLSISSGSAKLHADLGNTDKSESFEYQMYSIEHSEFARIFISVAILCRNLMDTHGTACTSEDPETRVGTLVRNGSISNLTFREACSKIVHADSYDYGKNIVYLENGINKDVKLKGSINNEEWLANIDIDKFCRSAWLIIG